MAVAGLVVGPVTAFPGRSLRWLRPFDLWAWRPGILAGSEAIEPCGLGLVQKRRPGYYTRSPQLNPTMKVPVISRHQ